MKILYPDVISVIAASTEDQNYPIENVLDTHPQKYWKATGTSATVTITNTGAFSCIGIYNTNATSITISVMNQTETTTYETATISVGTYQQVWKSFGATYSSTCHTVLSMSGSSTIYAGVIRLGVSISLNDPDYGLNRKRVDYSIKEELSNGGLYVYKRNTPKEFSFNITDLESKYDEIDDIYNAIGSSPLPFLLSEDLNNDNKWTGFFHIIEPPSAGYEFYNHVNISLNLKEAI